MNHKRKRPKHQRAGCIFCKPHKDEREPQRAHLTTQDHLATSKFEDEWSREEYNHECDKEVLDGDSEDVMMEAEARERLAG